MTPANKGKSYPPVPLTSAECRALLRHCGRGRTGVRNQAIVAIMWRAGLRSAEVLALLPKDVETSARPPVLRVLAGKGGKARTVGLDAVAVAFVERWGMLRRAGGFSRAAPLFCTLKGTPLGTAYLRRLLPRLGARAGIEKRCHPHALRHTFAREMADGRVPLRLIQGALGHEKAHTTSGYLGKIAAPEVVEAMAARLWEPASETDGLQGLLPLPEPRNAKIETHGADLDQRGQPPDGPARVSGVLALALLRKGQLLPKP